MQRIKKVVWYRLFIILPLLISLFACDSSIQLNIEDQTVVDNRLLELGGHFSEATPDTRFILNGNNAISTASDENGEFHFPYYLLQPGENVLEVIAEENGQLLSSISITVFYNDNSSGVEKYTVDGTENISLAITDPNDIAFGSAINIQAGSLDIDVIVSITSDPEHVPNLPLGVVAVGVPITFQPLGQVFTSPIQLSIPYTASKVPDGREDDIKIYALSDSGWVPFTPNTIKDNSLQLSISALYYGVFIAAIEQQYPVGTVVLRSNPSGATIYIDGVLQPDLSPTILASILTGNHEVKLYAPRFNEKFVSFNVVEQATILDLELSKPDPEAVPTVSIDSSISDEITVSDNIFSFTGDIVAIAGAVDTTRLVLSLNNIDSYIRVNTDGSFSHTVSLAVGENKLYLRATDTNGQTGISRVITVLNTEGASSSMSANSDMSTLTKSALNMAAVNKSITVVLTWDKDDTDIDMHMYDPKQNHASYADLNGIPGARLDIDDIDGFGPETFTYSAPISGEYEARVHYYSDHDNGSATANLTINVGNQEIFSDSKLMSNYQWWNAHIFTVNEFSITSILPTNGVFTTATGENELIVTLSVPLDIDPTTIYFEIKEIIEDHNVAVTNGLDGNNQKTVTLTHQPLLSLTTPASHALQYRITAFSNIDQTDAVEIEQDNLSQIRQEYVDKQEFDSSFNVSTPHRDHIITSANFPPTVNDFNFDEFSTFSDYGPTYAVINRSATIAQSLRTAWTYSLRVTSGWRNPRRNDGLSPVSSINSLHQSGDAVDLNPSWSRANWPTTATNYAQAQQALTLLAQETFGANYDVLFHANHLHIEYDP